MTADKKVETFVNFIAYVHLLLNLVAILLFLIYEKELMLDDLLALAILILVHHIVTVLGIYGMRKRSSRLMAPFDYLHLLIVLIAFVPFFFVIDSEAQFSRLEFILSLIASIVIFILCFLLFLVVLALSSAFEFEEEIRKANPTRRHVGVADGGEIV